MQPSNQLKGLVESYNSVYANRQELEEAKIIAETVINSVGVYMVEQGYTESDVKEFFKTSSIAKIDDVFEESLHSQTVQPHLNESLLFETHLRYIPGAMATRMKNESPEIVHQLTQSIVEFLDRLPGFKTGQDKGRGLRRFVKGGVKGLQQGLKQTGDVLQKGGEVLGDVGGAAVQGVLGRKTTSNRRSAQAANALGQATTVIPRTVLGTAGGVASGLMGGGSGNKNKTSSGSSSSGTSSKTKPDILSNLAGAGSPDAKAIQRRLSTPATDRLDRDERQQRNQGGTPGPTSGGRPQQRGGSSGGSRGGSSGGSRGGSSGRSSSGSRPAGFREPSTPITSRQAIAMGSKEGQGPKSAASTYTGANDKTKVGRYKTLAQHKAAVEAQNAKPSAAAGAVSGAAKKTTAKVGSGLNAALSSVKRFKKEEAELDMVVQYLVSEGIAHSLESALTVVEGLSDQFINSILEQCYLGSAMVEFLLQTEEAATIEEANYIISELDEENLNLLIQTVTEG